MRRTPRDWRECPSSPPSAWPPPAGTVPQGGGTGSKRPHSASVVVRCKRTGGDCAHVQQFQQDPGGVRDRRTLRLSSYDELTRDKSQGRSLASAQGAKEKTFNVAI